MPNRYQHRVSDNLYNGSLQTTEDGVYQVAATWNMSNGKCKISVIERGVQEFGVNHTEFITSGATDTELGVPVAADDHNSTYIGLHKVNGGWYPKMAGNMHNYGDPNRWRAIRSNNPLPNISSWTPDSDPTSIDARITYPLFISTPTELLLWARDSPHPLGGTARGNSGLWKATRNAHTYGARLPFTLGVNIPPSGSDDSVDDATNFSGYITHPYVESLTDPNPGFTHWFLCHRQFDTGGAGSPPEVDRSQVALAYFWSPPPYTNFYAIDGTPVVFPIHPGNNPAILLGTSVIDGSAGYFNGGDIALDKNGRPVMVISNQLTHIIQRNANNTAWVQSTIPQAGLGYVFHSFKNLVRFRNELWYLSTASKTNRNFTERWPMMVKLDNSKAFRVGPRVDPIGESGLGAWDVGYDKVANRLFGTVEVLTPQGDVPRVMRIGA